MKRNRPLSVPQIIDKLSAPKFPLVPWEGPAREISSEKSAGGLRDASSGHAAGGCVSRA